MKANIHPQYFPQSQVTCACGNIFNVGSTKQSIKVDLCHKCHPFYTGVARFTDTRGTIQKFQEQQKVAAAKQAVVKAKKEEKAKDANRPQTIKEMLQAMQAT